MLAESLHLLVHFRARFFAVWLLLAELLGDTAKNSLYCVEVSLLCDWGNVQLQLGNADGAVISLDDLTI